MPIWKMAYQMGNPKVIDNESIPKPIFFEPRPDFNTTRQNYEDLKKIENPQNVRELINNIAFSLKSIS